MAVGVDVSSYSKKGNRSKNNKGKRLIRNYRCGKCKKKIHL
jgi:hypothetical protein